jgi:hypothetical protein
MTVNYEDNFGFWEIDCPEERAFFRAREDPKRPRNLSTLRPVRPAHVEQ